MNIEEEIKEQAKKIVEDSFDEEVLHRLDFLIYAYFQDKEIEDANSSD